MHELTLELLKLWMRAYSKRPALTIVGTIIIVGMLATFIIINDRKEQKRQEEARLANADLSRQLDEMDRVKSSLQSLLTFVEDQRSKIKEGQETVAKLSNERSQLEPIVRSQHEVIDQIFAIQEQRAKRSKWMDISIGFILGIIGSFIASVIFDLIRRRLGKPPIVPSTEG
jgi:type II secretory pathway pseudopilin PulG